MRCLARRGFPCRVWDYNEREYNKRVDGERGDANYSGIGGVAVLSRNHTPCAYCA